MDPKQRKLVMIRAGAAVGILLILAFLGWVLFGPSGQPSAKQEQLGPSDTMAPEAVKQEQTVAPVANGTLTANPGQIQFEQDKPDTIIFTVQALGGPVAIRSAVIPDADIDTLKISNIDCPVYPQQGLLAEGKSCNASITWNGNRSVNSTITMTTGEGAPTAGGAPVAAPVATAPSPDGTVVPPPVAAGPQQVVIALAAVSTKAPGAAQAQNGQEVPPPAEGAQATAPQAAQGASPMQMMRDAYLAGRRMMGLSPVQGPGGLQPAARSPYASWDNIGVASRKSSAPTDMSRVITPDKPMTAVLTYQIDTRQTVTAVATVDRDVYGSSGRTVVMPRGSKIIGRVGGGATDRVGIAWNQIIRPDGVRFMFEGESGDAMGRGGVPGRINNRYLQRYGYSLLPTLASAGMTVALGGQSSTAAGTTGTVQSQDARAVAAQILQQPLTQIANDIYNKNGNIPVQITIPAGTRITVWSTGDLRLKPAGEEEPIDPRAAAQNGQTQQGGRQQGQGFGQGFGSQQGFGGNQQNQQPQQQTSNGANAPADDGAAMQVGTIDPSGTYVPPSSNAPAPPPATMNTNNAANRVTQGSSRGTTMPTNTNPWQ